MTASGQLYIIAAPSGAGKTSLVGGLIARKADVRVSVSHTTRAMRRGEQDGADYFFISEAEFSGMVKQHVFLEYAEVFGNLYGTSKHKIDETLSTGTDVILEIDWQGARQVRKLRPDVISVFIIPPSLASLRQRLEKRGQDSAEVIAGRLQKAVRDIAHYREFDYLIVNDQFEEALNNLEAIFTCHRLQLRRQQASLRERLDELLSSVAD